MVDVRKFDRKYQEVAAPAPAPAPTTIREEGEYVSTNQDHTDISGLSDKKASPDIKAKTVIES